MKYYEFYGLICIIFNKDKKQKERKKEEERRERTRERGDDKNFLSTLGPLEVDPLL